LLHGDQEDGVWGEFGSHDIGDLSTKTQLSDNVFLKLWKRSGKAKGGKRGDKSQGKGAFWRSAYNLPRGRGTILKASFATLVEREKRTGVSEDG